MEKVKESITRLLEREPEAGEGIAESEMISAEKALGISIPPALRFFYRMAGKNALLMDHFNHFALPDQLLVKDGKVLFLEEHEGVCFWGFDLDEAEPAVYMQPADKDSWYPETMKLDTFLAMMLYYQCAQGAYELGGTVGLDGEKLHRLMASEWESVVDDNNGLFILWKPGCLLWYLMDDDGEIMDDVYFSARTAERYKENEAQYELVAL